MLSYTLNISLCVSFMLCSVVASTQALKKLNHTNYRIDDGLMQNQVVDLAEDGNGFIWISTGSGLQRSDGKKFYAVTATKSNNSILDDKYVTFFRLANGNLWLRHSGGISEYNIFTNKFTNVISSGKKDAEHIPVPVYEQQEGIWCQIPAGGIYLLNKNDFRYHDSVLFETQAAWSSLIPFQKKGNILFAAFENNRICIANSKEKTYRLYHTGKSQGDVIGLANYSPDTLLVATQRGIEKFDVQTGEFTFVCTYNNTPRELATYSNIKLHRLANGNYLISEGRQIYELDLKQPARQIKLVTPQNQDFFNTGLIARFINDSHNNFWILSVRDGITKIGYQFSNFRYFGSADKKNNFVKTIYADKKDNRILCAAAGNGLLIFDTLQQLLHAIDHFPGTTAPHTIGAIHKISAHRYLLFLMRDWKVYLLNTKKFSLQPVRIDSSQFSLQHKFDYHSNVFSSGDNSMIMQSSFHIYKMEWQPPSVIRFSRIANMPSASVSSYLDREQRLWVGSRKKYYVLNNCNDSLQLFEMPENIIARCFYMDGAGSIWMGTEKGLYQLDKAGKVMNQYYITDGLSDDNIYAVTGDSKGNLWISHNKGISCMKPGKIFVHYNKYDGLQENEFNTNCIFKTGDGELFFGGVNGVSSFYPEIILNDGELPALFVTSVQIKDTEWETGTAAWNIKKIDLPYFKNNLAFEFTALGTRKPDQYNYQYRMAGADDEWINADNTGSARYVLPPGKYILELYVGNSFYKDAVPVKKIAITIHPPFWKTTWFFALEFLLITFIIITITRYITRIKLKRRVQELERKRALDEERLRIAREMHDDIGAGLTHITMMSEAAKTKTHTIEQLDKIADVSRKLVSNMSEIIWSMQGDQNTLDQLFAYLREQLHQLLEYSVIEYKIDFPIDGNDILLNNAQKRNLLLVTKEIVHNAIKHSQAKQLFIVAVQTHNFLRFNIADNGCGFDPERTNYGNGLRNIKRRVEEMGGTLSIESTAGKGSRFIYEVPLT